MQKRIRRIAVLTLGWALIALGVVGLFLPVLQGVLFIFLGLYLLSRESAAARRLLDKLRARYPSVDARLHSWRERFRREERNREKKRWHNGESAGDEGDGSG
ncbi:MAG: PGPGW domain-containing protein [Thermoanaerobaculales bacterium]